MRSCTTFGAILATTLIGALASAEIQFHVNATSTMTVTRSGGGQSNQNELAVIANDPFNDSYGIVYTDITHAFPAGTPYSPAMQLTAMELTFTNVMNPTPALSSGIIDLHLAPNTLADPQTHHTDFVYNTTSSTPWDTNFASLLLPETVSASFNATGTDLVVLLDLESASSKAFLDTLTLKFRDEWNAGQDMSFAFVLGGSPSLSATFHGQAGNPAPRIDFMFDELGDIPAPGALALLGLAGATGRRRRR